MKNVIERPIVPHNPSASKVVNKEQYSLFAPVAVNGRVGMAAFTPTQFDIKKQTVFLKEAFINALFKDTFKKINVYDLSEFTIDGIKEGNILYYNCTANIDDVEHFGVLLVVETAYGEDLSEANVTELFVSNGHIWLRSYNLTNHHQELSSQIPPFVLFASSVNDINMLIEKVNSLENTSVKKDASGNVTITGNLTVIGETTVVDTDVLHVDAPVAVVNTSYVDGETPAWINGGIVIMLDAENAFGLVYNRLHEKVIASLGKYKDGIFTANSADFVPLWNGTSTDGNLPMFEGGKLVPSGLSKEQVEQAVSKEWDHVITEVDDLINNLATYTGNILVKCGRVIARLDTKLHDDARRIKFVDTIIEGGMSLIGNSNSNCTIEGLRFAWSGTDTPNILQSFGAVTDCKNDDPYEPLHLTNCNHISNCAFEEANYCKYIDNCYVSPGEHSYIKLDHCKYICGIVVEQGGGVTTVLFQNCSYLSNIDIAGGDSEYVVEYKDCTYVDAQTCAQFISADDIGKIQALTNDGSFKTIDINKELAGVEEALRTINEGGVE